MIRWSYLGPRLAILVIGWVFFNFFMDPLIKCGAQKAGGKALGAKLDIGALDTDLFPPAFSLRRVCAADRKDPMRNLIEFAEAGFRLEGRPLLEKKLVIGSSSLKGLRWGTERKRSGALRKAPPSAGEKKLDEWAEKSRKSLAAVAKPAAARVAKDHKIDPSKLSALKLSDGIEKKWESSYGGLEKKINAFDPEAKIKEIEELLNKAKGSGSVPEKLKAAKELRDRVKSLRNEVKGLKRELDSAVAAGRSDLDAIKKAKNGDLDALFAELNLPSFDAEAISAYLVGPKAAAWLSRVLRLAQAARKRMPPKGKGKKPKKQARGASVEFPKERAWPAFWLKSLELGGEVDMGGPLAFSGEARDFSSSPAFLPKPAVIALSGKRDKTAGELKVVLDHREEVPTDSLSFKVRGLPMKEFQAGGSGGFGLRVSPGRASVAGAVELKGDRLSGTVTFREKGVKLTPEFGDSPKRVAQALGSAFDGIGVLEIKVSLSGTLDDPKLKIGSNLGKAAAKGLKRALGKQFAKQKRALRAQLDRLVGERTSELSKLAGGRQGALSKRLGLADGKLGGMQDRIKSELRAPLPKIKGLKGLKLFR